MKQFIFKGRLVLSGVDFFVEAESLEEARELMREGQFGFYETDGALMDDATVDPSTGRENV